MPPVFSGVPWCETDPRTGTITGLPLPELAKCTAANQARSLGLTDRGRLEPGLLADIVLLNDDFGVEAVFVGGERKV